MNSRNLRVVKNTEITSKILKGIVIFDRSIFPIDEEYSFPDGYLEKLYATYKDGLFALLDKDTVIGYVNCIFLSDEMKEYYLKTKDYLALKNQGLRVGNNNMYFYTLAIDKEYRDTEAVKILMRQFCSWINQEQKKGKKIVSCISEAITEDGIKTLHTMGMIPKDIDENGLGIYYSPDCLNNYIKTMIEKSIEEEER